MEALAQVPTWALVGGAVACAVVAVRLWLGQSWVFKIMYFLFAHTPLGPWWHRRGVAQHRAKHGSQPHRATHTTQHNGYSVTSVAFLSDNYAYVLKDVRAPRAARAARCRGGRASLTSAAASLRSTQRVAAPWLTPPTPRRSWPRSARRTRRGSRTS